MLGSKAETIGKELKIRNFTIVINEQWGLGMGTSISKGVSAALNAKSDLDHILILLSDQPFVTKEKIQEFKYDGDFLANSEDKERFEGYTELRKLSLDDEFIIRQIKKYISEIKIKGWLDFWLDNFSGKQERSYLKKRDG